MCRKILLLICIFSEFSSILAFNHFFLNEKGKIIPKIDSPFFLRESNNLTVFFEQIRHYEIVETTYSELLRKKEKMIEQINNSITCTKEKYDMLVQQLENVKFEADEQTPKMNSIQDFVNCLENLDKISANMYNYIEFVKEIQVLKQMKRKILASHDKIIQQQVPLGARYFDVVNEQLLHRGQYCSTRTLSGTNEPVLFCDFYSELQMRLESSELDLETLEREINASSEALRQRFSVEFQARFGIDRKRKIDKN